MYSCFVLVLVEEGSGLGLDCLLLSVAAACRSSCEHGTAEPEPEAEGEEYGARAPRSKLLDWTRKSGNFARALLAIFVKRVCSERDSGRRGMSTHP